MNLNTPTLTIRALAPRATSQETALPSSTVVAIGGGFVALALIVLSTLTLVRVSRLHLEARRERRAGRQATLLDLWERDGGFWGFITGLGGESAAGGAGFIDVARQRRWEEMIRWERWAMQGLDEEGMRN